MAITPMQRFEKSVNENGQPTLRRAQFDDEMTRQVNDSEMRVGEGTPEGEVLANPGSTYMDSLGSTGTILYIKKSGTAETGWVLV